MRALNIAIAASQLLHVVLTAGAGDPKMTTSARIGREVARGERWARWADGIISTVLFDHPDHCLRAYHRDRVRRWKCGQHDV